MVIRIEVRPTKLSENLQGLPKRSLAFLSKEHNQMDIDFTHRDSKSLHKWTGQTTLDQHQVKIRDGRDNEAMEYGY